ncbi:TIM barrel protein [Robinsoniella sp. KNHs210]|uniref:TIM barrel protein n=1 Tax=Robinsoniella sp. KNHs210 TaxID=1469950 RepID=UPI000482BE76|nr:TIM barrel protein [Robinsoniella sp. KNHs210]
MEYPKVYLTLDNCFAIKRWVSPKEWVPLIQNMGFTSVQASFDNEIDFLYSPDWYLDQWFEELEEQEKCSTIKVDTFFTGYQTYRTAGLGHPNDQMADYLMEEWVKKAIRRLGKRGSHMGMSFFAIPDNILQDPDQYKIYRKKIIKRLREIGRCAEDNGIYFCIEAMYAPHQPPWTIAGAKRFLIDCAKGGNSPVYLTIDVGHMIGQKKFQMPLKEELAESIRNPGVMQKEHNWWLGAVHTLELWKNAVKNKDVSEKTLCLMAEDMRRYPYLFSDGEADWNPYRWLEEMGCYSPIIHLQQTDGIEASHTAFTDKNNKKGIIEGEKLLRSIAKSYEKALDGGMPDKCNKIYLAFEIFAGNTEYREDIIEKLMETLAYWKQFVPNNGIRLNELLDRLDRKAEKSNEGICNGQE